MSDPANAPAAERRRILTGLRPSGPSHVGHYAGAFSQWLELQDEYESFFLLADYQVSDYADNLPWIRWGLWEVTLDWLGVGLDPNLSHFVIESGVPEFAELTLHLSWFLGLGHLQRNPTLKAELASLATTNKTVPVAFFNYPVMQISNILLPLAHLVPVGEDQLPHIEMTRDVAIRFNRRFGETFVVPEGRVGEVPRLVGIDGKGKMGTSAGNAIFLKGLRGDAAGQGAQHVHGSEASAGNRSGDGGRQPGVHVPRRLQPEHGRGGRPEGALPDGQGRRRGG